MNVRIEHLSKQFHSLRGTTDALSDITLEVRAGEFLVILGPSGCGKSTLLNLIAGLERPTDGAIYFEDRPVCSPHERVFMEPGDRNVAMVFQNYALYPHLNVYDNIAFPLRTGRASRETLDRAVREAAERVRIGHLFAARPGELSGGERQRVAIARAIVRKPNVFLLDEPLSNLDAALRLSTRIELRKLQKDLGVTTIYVTHDQSEAMALGDRVAVMRYGRIEQVATPADLYERPQTTFVAGFIGQPPMNFLEGRLTVRGDGLEFASPKDDSFIALDQYGETLSQTSGPMILGLRPEDVLLGEAGSGEGLMGTVERCERLGREAFAYLRVGPWSLCALVQGSDPREGDTTRVSPRPGKLHFFVDGYRLGRPAPA